MPRINKPRVGMSNTISIAPDGIVTFPRLIMDRLGWKAPMRIAVDHLEDKKIKDAPLVLFLNADNSAEGEGYSLSTLNRSSSGKPGSGGKTSFASLTHHTIAPRVSLPRKDIEPIYPANSLADLVLMLTEPVWQVVEFTMAGCSQIGDRTESPIGTYELLGGDGTTLRVGEGLVQTRIREHLRDDRLVRAVKKVRYFPLTEKQDAETMEQVLLAQYETRYEALPQFNTIRG